MIIQNKQLSIVAYYLSKYDMDAVYALGYSTRTEAINNLSHILGNGNNYLKLRRDEFDVLTGSSRKGYHNRAPVPSVLRFHELLKSIDFNNFTEIILQLISNHEKPLQRKDTIHEIKNFSETDVEAWINAKDVTSKQIRSIGETLVRVYNKEIISNLKKLYQYKCQICEYSFIQFGVDISEAHHIVPFSISENNNADNIIILCPNHHRLLHKASFSFDRENEIFILSEDFSLPIKLNLHL